MGGSCELVEDSVPSPAGMGHRMGKCRTGQVKVSICLMWPNLELTLDGSFMSIQEPSMSKPVSAL